MRPRPASSPFVVTLRCDSAALDVPHSAPPPASVVVGMGKSIPVCDRSSGARMQPTTVALTRTVSDHQVHSGYTPRTTGSTIGHREGRPHRAGRTAGDGISPVPVGAGCGRGPHPAAQILRCDSTGIHVPGDFAAVYVPHGAPPHLCPDLRDGDTPSGRASARVDSAHVHESSWQSAAGEYAGIDPCHDSDFCLVCPVRSFGAGRFLARK
jgi:hypothetical protein